MSIALADSAAIARTEVEAVGMEVVLSDEAGMEVEVAGRRKR